VALWRAENAAINNVELISDRPLEVNLREIAEVKRAWPDRAVVVSAMVESSGRLGTTLFARFKTPAPRDRVELRVSARYE